MNVRQVLPPDAIPSIDDPEFGVEYFGTDEDEVIVLDRDGDVRAYPVRILNYHEIVNAEHAGPVAVTWCPLCASTVAYDREVAGRTLTFGVSGKLADDDLVMFDRETESEWKQSLGRAIAGEFEGTDLTMLPAGLVSYGRFRERYPDALVLQPPGGKSEAASETDEPAEIRYDEEPYSSYFEMDGFGLNAHRGGESRTWDRDELGPKDIVLGIERDGDVLGFTRERVLAAGGLVRARVGDLDVVVVAGEEGIHAYEDPGFSLARGEGALHGDETAWDPGTGASDDGRELVRVPARRLFAFAWHDDHGDAFWTV